MPVYNTFIVTDSGTLSLDGYKSPETREEAYNISSNDFLTASGLAFVADMHQPVLWKLQDLFYDWRKNEIVKLSAKNSDQKSLRNFEIMWDEDYLDDVTNVEYWLESLSKDQFASISDNMHQWGLEDPSGDDDEYIDEPMSGQDMAYQMFSDGCYSDESEILGIEIVEGDHPGSSYIAAVLSIPIIEANKKANELGLDLRFKNQPVLIYASSDNFTMLSSWVEELYCWMEDDGSLSFQEHKRGDGRDVWFDVIKNIRTAEDIENAVERLFNIDAPSIDEDFVSSLKKVNAGLAEVLELRSQ